jgi:hypothetical protein
MTERLSHVGICAAYNAAIKAGATSHELGSGSTRVAYTCKLFPDIAFKKLRMPGFTDNEREFNFWNAAPDDVREHLAPLCDYNAKLGLLAMARTDASTAQSASREWVHLLDFGWSSDCHAYNVGLYQGRWVMHDYGHCRIDQLPSTRDGNPRAEIKRPNACACNACKVLRGERPRDELGNKRLVSRVLFKQPPRFELDPQWIIKPKDTKYRERERKQLEALKLAMDLPFDMIAPKWIVKPEQLDAEMLKGLRDKQVAHIIEAAQRERRRWKKDC